MTAETKVNATGDQIQFILDKLLYTAVRPFIVDSDLFDLQLVYILTSMTKNRKRKLVTVDRDIAIDTLARSLIVKDKAEKFILVKSLGLERQLVQMFLAKVVKDYKATVNALYSDFLTTDDKPKRRQIARRLHAISRELGFEKRSSMFVAINKTSDYLDLYNEYFSTVAGEYVKLCSSLAKAHVDSNPHNQFDFYDVRQGFLQNLIVALNKYDSSKGALTSYIKWWIFNAQTCANNDHEYGIAYTVPPSQKRKLATIGSDYTNFSTSLDQIFEGDSDDSTENLHSKVSSSYDLESDVINTNLADKIKMLTKHADIDGCARLTLDIDEIFSESELDKMRKVMRSQGLKTFSKSINTD